jgi:hypothetical protein
VAETDAAAEHSGSAFGFLGHKLFGKIPVWAVAAAAVGGYYWYTRYGPGKKSSTAQGVTGTDPAGNTGTIDPATGFVYGSPEDLAVLAGQSGTSSAGNYQDWQDQQSGGGGTSGGGPVTGTIPTGAGEGPAPVPGPGPVPVTGIIPGVGKLGEGPVPAQPYRPGVGKLGEGPRPLPRPVPRRGKAGPAPVRSMAKAPTAR